MSEPLSLAKPMHIRAEMVRAGLGPGQLRPYEDPEFGHTDPFNDRETRAAIQSFLHRLWNAALAAGDTVRNEAASDPERAESGHEANPDYLIDGRGE